MSNLTPSSFFAGGFEFSGTGGGRAFLRRYDFKEDPPGIFTPFVSDDFANVPMANDLVVDGGGDIFVSSLTGNVDIYTAMGQLRGSIAAGNPLHRPGSVASVALDGRIFVLFGGINSDDYLYNLISVYDSEQAGLSSGIPRVMLYETKAAVVEFERIVIGADGLIYVSQVSSEALPCIRIYPALPEGYKSKDPINPDPWSALRSIVGPTTQLRIPMGMAFDSQDNLYVASGSSVLVFAAGASDDVAPIRVIEGSETTFSLCVDVAIDGDDNLYVAHRPTDTSTGGICIFPANASGNIKPEISIDKINPNCLDIAPTWMSTPVWARRTTAAVTRFMLSDIPDPPIGPQVDVLIGLAAHRVASLSTARGAVHVQEAAMRMIVEAAEQELTRLKVLASRSAKGE